MIGNSNFVKETPEIPGFDIRANGSALLHTACQEDEQSAVEVLLDTGADIEIRDNRGRTSLHKAAMKGRREITEFLIQRGAKIEARCKGLRSVEQSRGIQEVVFDRKL
ncbi:hypothetical protein ACJQWK_02585 [Exserohilum turcicum]